MPFLSMLLLWFIVGSLSLLFTITSAPFGYFNSFVRNHPLETTRTMIGFLTSGLIAYLFDLPYIFEISFGGGILSLLLGEII